MIDALATHLAAKVKAARSLSLNYTEVNVDDLERVLAELGHRTTAPAEPVQQHDVDDRVRTTAVKVGHAAAEEAVRTMAGSELGAWLRDLDLTDGLNQEAYDQLCADAHKLLTGAQVVVTFPELYAGVGDPEAV